MRYFFTIQILIIVFIMLGFMVALFLRKREVPLSKLITIFISTMLTVLLYLLVTNITYFYNDQIKEALNTNFSNLTFLIFACPLLALGSTVFFLNRYTKKKNIQEKIDQKKRAY